MNGHEIETLIESMKLVVRNGPCMILIQPWLFTFMEARFRQKVSHNYDLVSNYRPIEDISRNNDFAISL